MTESEWGFDPTVQNLFQTVDVVAEVYVHTIEEDRFDTPSGQLPTRDPMGLDYGLRIYAASILNVAEYYKGAQSHTGFMVPAIGGQRDGVEYTESWGDMLEEGATGVVFLRVLESGETPMENYLLQRADELTNATLSYGAGVASAFYAYFGNEVYNATSNELLQRPDFIATMESVQP